MLTCSVVEDSRDSQEPAPGADVAGGSASDRKLILLVLAPGGIREFDLPLAERCTVGRSSSAQVSIDDPSVSRIHAQINPGPDGPLLLDLGSKNGTFVNGTRLGQAAVPLKQGDTMRFGNATAQVLMIRSRRIEMARVVLPEELEVRVVEEAERCVRFDRSLAVISAEVPARGEHLEEARGLVVRSLRSLDYVALRGSGRMDLLITECTKDEAMAIAKRLDALLASRSIDAQLGVAVYPGDAPSPESLLLAAQLAMRSVRGRGIAAAREAARILQVGNHQVVVAEPSMIRLFGLIERVAAVVMPVLIVGDTGTGKEIIAEALHALGPRAGRPLVKLNCAAVPENLLESELFGFERGAFSGAVGAKPGLIEQAEGGTLFLDEIGEMSPALQAKLLRVLEDHRVRRVGGLKDKEVDVRVVAATHRDLKSFVGEGRFRQDLYYRLNALVLNVPPLQERKREIVLLAERFAAEAARASGRSTVFLSTEAAAALETYPWPGNVRELRNVISRAVVICDGPEIDCGHLPPEIGGVNVPEPVHSPATTAKLATVEMELSLEEELRAVERRRILQALEACQGNQTRAAQLLKMPRRTLVSKLATLGIDGPRRRRSAGATEPGPDPAASPKGGVKAS
ncbi:MAG: sigma 54-interacting transcriptional regulator [Deltaproteobacteria bacterium]|nr:sigma 54-interacting transcriptional regulator [Deltaproteobacteria bacterium]